MRLARQRARVAIRRSNPPGPRLTAATSRRWSPTRICPTSGRCQLRSSRARWRPTAWRRRRYLSAPATDLAALQRELSSDNGDSHHLGDGTDETAVDDAVIDEYGEYRR